MDRITALVVVTLVMGGCASPQPPSCADQGPLRPINEPAAVTYTDPVTGEELPLPAVPGQNAPRQAPE